MLKLTVEIQGEDEGDLSLALEEVKRSVESGNTSGLDRNESGSYHFDLELT